MSFVRRPLYLALALLVGLWANALHADIARFIGDYSGTAEVETYDGTMAKRDMSVSISATDKGFSLRWNSTTYRDGTAKTKSYRIAFVPSDRPDVYAAAMTKNVFGHQVPLDPMKGEPYVWARITGDTLTVYSLYVTDTGGYELQQFDRTLSDGGLDLEFTRLTNGETGRTISTFLKREN